MYSKKDRKSCIEDRESCIARIDIDDQIALYRHRVSTVAFHKMGVQCWHRVVSQYS